MKQNNILRKSFMTYFLPAALVLAAILAVNESSEQVRMIAIPLLILLALYIFADGAAFKAVIGQNDITIKDDILTREKKVIPYESILSVDKEQDFLQRLIGCGNIEIMTTTKDNIALQNVKNHTDAYRRIMVHLKETNVKL